MPAFYGFDSRKAWEAEIRAIVDGVKVNEDLDAARRDWVLDNVLAHHHRRDEKLGALLPGGGLGAVQVRVNVRPGIAAHRGFWLVSKDRSAAVDFSWTKIRGPAPRKRAAEDDGISAAAREAVAPSIGAFRASVPEWKCAVCDTVSTTGYHVDHDRPLFKDIVKTWRASFSGSLATEDIGLGRRFLDPHTRLAFVEYHDKTATLRVLCAPCNLRRARGGV
jgi:hypothetical protein